MAHLALMEQLALYFTSLPCPPLPVRVNGMITTSHDMLAGLLIAAMTRGNRALDAERKQKQISITRKLVSQCESASAATDVYAHCKEFTAEYMHAFDDAGTCTPTMCFLGTDEVEKGDKVHSAICSWHAAQDILFVAPAEQRKAAVFALMSYEQLIKLHWQRFGASLDDSLGDGPDACLGACYDVSHDVSHDASHNASLGASLDASLGASHDASLGASHDDSLGS